MSEIKPGTHDNVRFCWFCRLYPVQCWQDYIFGFAMRLINRDGTCSQCGHKVDRKRKVS